MTIKKANGIEDKNGDTVVFIPPAPTDNELGGISKSDVEQINTNKTDIASVNNALNEFGIELSNVNKTIDLPIKIKTHWSETGTINISIKKPASRIPVLVFTGRHFVLIQLDSNGNADITTYPSTTAISASFSNNILTISGLTYYTIVFSIYYEN